VFIVSKKASTSRGADGSSEIRNAQRWRSVLMNTDLKRGQGRIDVKSCQVKTQRGRDIPVCYMLTRASTECVE
jgi:hypothetical protein